MVAMNRSKAPNGPLRAATLFLLLCLMVSFGGSLRTVFENNSSHSILWPTKHMNLAIETTAVETYGRPL
jgi:hypothetical protein